ncbi:restriction endonuclease subunit S [Pontibacter sp. FD36]|uniref:restriction endonuclease subunit S n=1 Tax=Pontibacter sp. FD36 TaxID=2789860 RepID=UPI0018AC237E|nr:restriction endonuclease subunit S [Pontibacter sp. FD36]MBF8962948.1 restriction endonuclease subunit S [Pontibacter sp. FD36]
MIDKSILPAHWEVKKLGEVVQVLDNLRKPINSTERQKRIADKKQEELFPYYGATGQVGWIDDFLTEGEFILIGEDGAPFLDIFKSKAYLIKGRTWVNNHAHILKEKDSVTLNKYILHFLNSINYREFVNGTTRLKLTKGSLIEIPFVLPPLSEQQEIVSKIEELFSELDKGKEQLETALKQLKVYRQAVLKWAFEVDKNRYTATTLSEISDKIQIGPFGTQLHKEDYIEGGIPLINPMHIVAGLIKADSSYSISVAKRDTLPNYILREGDVIMGRRGEMGRCALVTSKEDGWFCGTGSLFVRPNTELVDPEFLYFYLSNDTVKKYLEQNAGGTTMANLNLKIVNNIPVHLPNLEEQHQIVQEIESRLSVCDKVEETITKGIQQAETLRQSILKKAFEGKLVKVRKSEVKMA